MEEIRIRAVVEVQQLLLSSIPPGKPRGNTPVGCRWSEDSILFPLQARAVLYDSVNIPPDREDKAPFKLY